MNKKNNFRIEIREVLYKKIKMFLIDFTNLIKILMLI